MGKEHGKPAELTKEEIKELNTFRAIASSFSPFLTFPILLIHHNDLMRRISRHEKPTSISEK